MKFELNSEDDPVEQRQLMNGKQRAWSGETKWTRNNDGMVVNAKVGIVHRYKLGC
jgi:hypothetical protein